MDWKIWIGRHNWRHVWLGLIGVLGGRVKSHFSHFMSVWWPGYLNCCFKQSDLF